MSHPVDHDLLKRYRAATGLPWVAVRQILGERLTEEQKKLVDAKETAGSGCAFDPLEQDDVDGPIIQKVIGEVAAAFAIEHEHHLAEIERETPDVAKMLRSGRGTCNVVWSRAKQRLLEDHGIDWKTPNEMNPGVAFD